MKIFEVINQIEKTAMPHIACDWDNVGLILGHSDREVTRVLTALDFDMDVAKKAKEVGANLIVTHHPIMFSPINKINDMTAEGRSILFMLENEIALYSAHTSLDAAEGGTNDYLAELFGLAEIENIEITYTDETGKTYGIGRKGRLEYPMALGELAAEIAMKLELDRIEYIGDDEKIIETVSIVSGGGGSMINSGIKTDAYITGDIKYSNARNAEEMGLSVIIAPHYSTEIFATEILKKLILGVDVVEYKNPNIIKSCEVEV